MDFSTFRSLSFWLVLLLAFGLWGCGGGGGGGGETSPPPTTQPEPEPEPKPEPEPEPEPDIDPSRQVLNTLALDGDAPKAQLVDVTNGRLYLAFSADKRVEVIDIESGEPQQSLYFDHEPEALALSSDGTELYVAQIHHEHSSYRWDDEQSGTISVIDLESFEVSRSFETDIDPFDMVVDSAGRLIVSSGSGQWTQLHVLSGTNGEKLGEGGVREQTTLALSADGTRLYGLEGGDITRFDLAESGEVSSERSFYLDFDYYDNEGLWPSTDNRHLITHNGSIVSTGSMTVQRQLPVGDDPIASLFADDAQGVTFIAAGNQAMFINSASLEAIAETDLFGPVTEAFAYGPYAYYLVSTADELSLVREGHPCPDCGENTAPSARFTIDPSSGATTQTFNFDASTSTDPDGDSLSYRWDIGADGSWETDGYSNESSFSYDFILPGSHAVRLQVKDEKGLIDRVIKIVEVDQGTLEATVIDEGSTPEISPTYTLKDDARRRLYVSDAEAKRLYVYDVDSGRFSHYFDLPYGPRRTTMSPDGNRLYIALPLRAYDSYDYDDDGFGLVAEINLQTLTHTQTVPVNTPPFDLAVNEEGVLFVASGSSSHDDLTAYDLASKTLLGESYMPRQARVFYRTQSDTVIAVNDYDISEYQLNGGQLTRLRQTNLSWSDGNAWHLPEADVIVDARGQVFDLATFEVTKTLLADSQNIESLSVDPVQGVMVATLNNGYLMSFNSQSLEQISSDSLLGGISGVFLFEDQMLYEFSSEGSSDWVSTDHPCPNCATNMMPQASLSIDPTNGDTSDTYTFDASASTDMEDADNLTYRWDVDGDGLWDTAFSSQSQYQHHYILPGQKRVRVQVKDTLAMVHSAEATFSVAQGIESAQLIDGAEANRFEFAVNDVVSDTAHNRLYLIDKGLKRLYVVNSETGVPEAYFPFSTYPLAMAITPDQQRLYVASGVNANGDYYSSDPTEEGFISILDLEALTRIKTYKIDVDPFDIVVNGSDKLVVSSRSNQWTEMGAFAGQSGEKLGSAGIRHRSYLAMHPDGSKVFSANTDLSPSDIEHYDISGSGIAHISDSPYHGDHRMYGNIWAAPNGQYVITRGGDVFSASDLSFVASLTPQGLSIEHLTFSDDGESVYLIGSDDAVYQFSLSTWIQTGVLSLASEPRYVLTIDGEPHVISGTQGDLTLQALAF